MIQVVEFTNIREVAMTMEFRIPGYFESLMVKVLDSDGAPESAHGFGKGTGLEAEDASPDALPAPDYPYVEEDDLFHGPEV